MSRYTHYVEVFTFLGETKFRVHRCKGNFDRDLLSPNMIKVYRVLGAKTKDEAIALALRASHDVWDLKHQVSMGFGT